jgi:DNA repair protein RecN (Recombination protein N)
LAGVSADRGAEVVGLSQNHQVVCITHLPQLAVMATRTSKSKRPAKMSERLHVAQLNDKARVDELAQMLGASGDGAIKSAKEIENVADEKS